MLARPTDILKSILNSSSKGVLSKNPGKWLGFKSNKHFSKEPPPQKRKGRKSNVSLQIEVQWICICLGVQ